MGRAKPDVRPPGAAIPSAKSIAIAEIPLAAMRILVADMFARWRFSAMGLPGLM